MNAYELADKLDWHWDNDCRSPAISQAADMLRQQADRIAELEKKELNAGGEPVKNATYWKRQYDKLKTKTKPLSDEEIDKILESLDVYIDTHAGVKLFARAIEERHGIK